MNGWKTISMFVLFSLILGFVWWTPVTANSEETIRISGTAGFDGDIKPNQWVPVQVTVTNNGAAVQGKVFISNVRAAGHHFFTGMAEQEVELAQGTTKKLSFLIPEQALQGTQTIVFEVDGKQVSSAKLPIRRLMQDTLTVGVLSSSPDTSTFLNSMDEKRNNRQVRIYSFTEETVPNMNYGLSGLDILIINDFSSDIFTAEQVAVIEQWVSQGGKLILAGGADYEKGAAPFQSLSPVNVTGTKQVTSLAALETYVHQEHKLAFTSPATVSTGTLVDGSSVYVTDDGIPIIASKPYGDGEVVYAAYNLAVAPFNSWEGNRVLWRNIIGETGSTVTNDADEAWSLMEAARSIPTVKHPNVILWGGMFIVYAIVVGPILYLLLRRKDRRVWAWGIIPVIALLLTVGIYTIGSQGRGDAVIVHNVNVMKLENETGDIRGASAIISPRGGTYTVTWPSSVTVWPVSEGIEPYDARVSFIDSRGTRIEYTRVPSWTVRQAYVEGQIAAGKIVADLAYEGDRIVGDVTNESQFDLTDVYVVTGGDVQAVGDFRKGESKRIETRMSLARPDLFGQLVLPGQRDRHSSMSREEALLQYIDMGSHEFSPYASYVQLIGWTEQPVYENELDGQPSKQFSQTLVLVPLDVSPGKDGTIRWPVGMLRPKVTESSGNIDVDPHGIYFYQGKGTAVLTYRLHAGQEVELIALKVDMLSDADEVTWFNWRKGEWEHVDVNRDNVSLKDYLSEKNELKMNVTIDKQMTDGFYFEYPQLYVEGRVVE